MENSSVEGYQSSPISSRIRISNSQPRQLEISYAPTSAQHVTAPSLDKDRKNWSFSDNDLSNQDLVRINNRFSYKISMKAKESLNMRIQIMAFFRNQFGIELPGKYQDFKDNAVEIMEGAEDHFELAAAAYKIFSPIGIYSAFNHGNEEKSQVIGYHYSRHRLDPVWNYRKSQLIRKTWREYLADTGVHREYIPCHLVLTVPHKGGEWNGKRFYARELIEKFNTLRRRSAFKKNILGGEFGVEVKKGKKIKGSKGSNGLHIHIHSLCFMRKDANVHDVRKGLLKAWKRVLGLGKDAYCMLHYETLYYYNKDENGDWEKESVNKPVVVEKKDDSGDYYYDLEDSSKEIRKKTYIDENSDDEAYLRGIMECMKYHFKADDLYVRNSKGKVIKNSAGYPIYDIVLIDEILSNSKGLRFYNKFGFCYKEERLNYNAKVERRETDLEDVVPHDLEFDDDDKGNNGGEGNENGEEPINMGDIDSMEAHLINPFTNEKCNGKGYKLYVAVAESIKHNSPSDLFAPREPKIRGKNGMFEIDDRIGAKEAMKAMLKKEWRDLLSFEAYQEFEANGRSLSSLPEYGMSLGMDYSEFL